MVISGRAAPETTLPGVTLPPEHARALRNIGRKTRDDLAERERIIKAAVEAGGSLREVGEAVGLSHTAVKFIAFGRPKKATP